MARICEFCNAVLRRTHYLHFDSRNCDALPHRKCDNSTATIPTFDLAPNQNHRLRIINTGVLAEFQIELDEHSFAVTEVDGTDVLPSYIHRLIINPAQRYSLVVATNVTTGDSFWLRTRMATDCWDKSFPNPDLIAGTDAIIRYRDESETRKENAISPWGFPSSQPWGEAILQFCKDLNTTELVPVPAIAASEQVDHSFYLYSNFRIGAWRLSRGFFNDSSWRPNIHSPMLDRFIDGRKSGNESFMAEEAGVNHKAFNTGTEMAIQVEGIKTIDLVIQNINEGLAHSLKHPIAIGANLGQKPSNAPSWIQILRHGSRPRLV
jgi:hypothetical protein